MMKWLLLLLVSGSCLAQPLMVTKIAKDCSSASLKKNLYFLASDQMEGRLMASHGDTLASRFVAEWFKIHQLQAPYARGKSYYQAVTAFKQVDRVELTMAGKSYPVFDGWSLYPRAPLELKDVPVLMTAFNTPESFNAHFAGLDVKGKALVLNGPVMVKALTDGSIDSLEIILKQRGAVAVIWYDARVEKTINRLKSFEFLPNYEHKELDNPVITGGFPEVGFTPAGMNHLLAADQLQVNTDGTFTDSLHAQPFVLKTTLNVVFARQMQPVQAPNIIGFIKGTDTTQPCVVVSAHHDHDGRNGDKIYYGAVDNASGTVATMELAAMVNKAVKQGLRPKRSIVFASFTGEERGLLGSLYYVKHPLYSMEKTFAVLNLDMLGRVDTFYSGKKADSSYAYIIVKDSLNRGLRKALYSANAAFTNLTLDTHYEEPAYSKRMLLGSDQYSFYLKGVPFVSINCGFCTDYHKPTDTPDKINYELLTKQTQLAFLTLWNIANE